MSITSKAAIGLGNGRFLIDTIDVGNPGPGEVLVRIRAAGICHTDHDSLNWGKSIVLGHEGAGIVHKIGAGVTKLNAGDKVVLNWAIPCQTCFQCDSGNEHLCEQNSPVTNGDKSFGKGHAKPESTLWNEQPIERSFNLGTISEYTLVKEEACVPFLKSNSLSFESASIIGCGVMTGYGSVVNAAKLKTGASAVVIGTGGVGLNVIQGARIAGAGKIIAVDINQNRLDMAQQFGATHTFLADKHDTDLKEAVSYVKQLTENRGADYAFECTAIPRLGAIPLAMVRHAGVAIQVSGIEEEITIDMNLFEWDKIYMNPLYGKCRPMIDFPLLMKLYEKQDLMLDELITRTYQLEDLEKAFDDMLHGRNAKGVITFGS